MREPETAKYTLEQLLKGYTINNAVRMRLEDKTGSLEAGKYANFIVLAKDIFNTSPEDVGTVTAECTYFEGEKRNIVSTLNAAEI